MEENFSVDIEKCGQAEAEERAGQQAMLSVAKIVYLIIGVFLFSAISLKYGLGNGVVAAFIIFVLIYYPIKIGIKYF